MGAYNTGMIPQEPSKAFDITKRWPGAMPEQSRLPMFEGMVELIDRWGIPVVINYKGRTFRLEEVKQVHADPG